jgi:hypothetical protein
MGEATPAFLQYGALGLLALICVIAVRVLFQQVASDKARETERADRNEEALRELNRAVREQVIPAALEMVGTTKALIDLMAQERARRRE